MMFKNKVCLNLTTQTSKYRLDVLCPYSQRQSVFHLSGFYWPFSSKCKKALLNLLYMFWGELDINLSHFLNITSKEIDFEVWNCKKLSPEQKKSRLKITPVSWSVKIWPQFDIPSWYSVHTKKHIDGFKM
jgi:hypothetical protein